MSDVMDAHGVARVKIPKTDGAIVVLSDELDHEIAGLAVGRTVIEYCRIAAIAAPREGNVLEVEERAPAEPSGEVHRGLHRIGYVIGNLHGRTGAPCHVRCPASRQAPQGPAAVPVGRAFLHHCKERLDGRSVFDELDHGAGMGVGIQIGEAHSRGSRSPLNRGRRRRPGAGRARRRGIRTGRRRVACLRPGVRRIRYRWMPHRRAE